MVFPANLKEDDLPVVAICANRGLLINFLVFLVVVELHAPIAHLLEAPGLSRTHIGAWMSDGELPGIGQYDAH